MSFGLGTVPSAALTAPTNRPRYGVLPSRSLRKASRVLSGDQEGLPSFTTCDAELLVTCFAPLPSGFMVQIAKDPAGSVPDRSLLNAISLPSGDQAGLPSAALLLVRRARFDPSAAFIV